MKRPNKKETKKPSDIRLNRFVANAGVCSHREADSLISAGKIKVNGASMSPSMLTSVLAARAQTYGSNNVEVMIRGDKRARHKTIRQAMDAAANAGLWRIKFQAMKEPAET